LQRANPYFRANAISRPRNGFEKTTAIYLEEDDSTRFEPAATEASLSGPIQPSVPGHDAGRDGTCLKTFIFQFTNEAIDENISLNESIIGMIFPIMRVIFLAS
jgi:hypothetical protein